MLDKKNLLYYNTTKLFLLISFLFLFFEGGAEIIAPGAEYICYSLPAPNKVNVIKYNRTQVNLELHIGFPEKKVDFSSPEKTSTIFSRYDNPPKFDVVAGINGSFFLENKNIVGALASENNLIHLPNCSWESFAITDSRDCLIFRNLTSEAGVLKFVDGSSIKIDSLNKNRKNNTIACYTPHWGETTSTSTEGIEIIIQNVSYPLRPNKEVSGIVGDIKEGINSINNKICEDGMILSANGDKAELLKSKIHIGDHIFIKFHISPPIYNNAEVMITGSGWLLKGGNANSTEWNYFSPSFVNSRHPRTALAWNLSDIFMVTVDGRQSDSVGMTFTELANFLLKTLNATDAINLDGGGSTTMVINGKVVNNPSDIIGERPVCNALLLVKEPENASYEMRDDFLPIGRQLKWDDKSYFNGVEQFSPKAPQGDGYVMIVKDTSGGFETTHIGNLADSDYYIEVFVYCEYRPDVSSNGFERYGIFARDNGNFAFTSTSYGGGYCYAFTYDSNNGRVQAGKVIKGDITDFLGNKKRYIKNSGWHKYKISCCGSKISYYLDDVLLISVNDQTFLRGFAGIGYKEYFKNNDLIHGTRVDNFLFSPVLP